MQVSSEAVDFALYLLPLGAPQTLGNRLEIVDYPGAATALPMLKKRGYPLARRRLIVGMQVVRHGPQRLFGVKKIPPLFGSLKAVIHEVPNPYAPVP